MNIEEKLRLIQEGYSPIVEQLKASSNSSLGSKLNSIELIQKLNMQILK